MENYFIIHGSFGSPFGNWFSWLHDFITEDGKQVYVPDFPIGVGYQNYENWSKLLKDKQLAKIKCLEVKLKLRRRRKKKIWKMDLN